MLSKLVWKSIFVVWKLSGSSLLCCLSRLAVQILPVLAQTEVWQQQIYFNSYPLFYFCRILPPPQLLDIFVEHLSGKAKAQSLG